VPACASNLDLLIKKSIATYFWGTCFFDLKRDIEEIKKYQRAGYATSSSAKSQGDKSKSWKAGQF
jgi:hypothetical protein